MAAPEKPKHLGSVRFLLYSNLKGIAAWFLTKNIATHLEN